MKEIEAKLEVITRSKQAAESTISEKVSHLEKALEEVRIKHLISFFEKLVMIPFLNESIVTTYHYYSSVPFFIIKYVY